jgi:hypothetical protein
VSGAVEHLLRGVDADDPVAARDQLGGEQAGATGDVEDVVDVAGPELVEEGCDRVVAGVDDDLVVDPRQPRVGLDRGERLDPQSLGLRRRELLVREDALLVELGQLLELRVRVLRGRCGRSLLLCQRLLAHLLLVLGLVLRLPLLVLPAGDAAGHGGGGAGDDGGSCCHAKKSHLVSFSRWLDG